MGAPRIDPGVRGGRAAARTNRRRALEVLDERYARDEIGRDEYLQKRRDFDNPT